MRSQAVTKTQRQRFQTTDVERERTKKKKLKSDKKNKKQEARREEIVEAGFEREFDNKAHRLSRKKRETVRDEDEGIGGRRDRGLTSRNITKICKYIERWAVDTGRRGMKFR